MQNNDEHSSTNKVTPIILSICFIIVMAIGAMLYPAFRRTGGHAHSDNCRSNLMQLGRAVHMYANDYDGVLPSSASINKATKWNRSDFVKYATGGTSCPPSGRLRTYSELIYKYLPYKDEFFCPDDPETTSGRQRPQTSYWWKLAVDKAWYGDGCTKPYRRINDYHSPAEYILLFEHDSWHFKHPGGLRNGAMIIVSHIDTHVKCVTIYNATSGDPVNCAASSDGEPMYFNYDTKTKTALPENIPAKYVDPGRYADSFN